MIIYIYICIHVIIISSSIMMIHHRDDTRGGPQRRDLPRYGQSPY